MEPIKKERLKEIECLVNDFFISKDSANQLVINNVEDYYTLAVILKVCFQTFQKEEEFDFKSKNIAKSNLFKNIEIVSGFYKEYNINFDIDEIIKDGTIEFLNCEPLRPMYGKSYYENEKRLIDSCNNGLVTDSVTLMHEICHFRNQPLKGRYLTSFTLTETVSYAEEFVFFDYLSKIGYEYESDVYKAKLFNISYKLAVDMCAIYKFAMLFQTLGSLSKESYQFYFRESSNYEQELKIVDDFIKNKEHPTIASKYIMAVALGLFMYNEYKNNEEFMTNIENLHTMINNERIIDCFKSMNLGSLEADDLEKVYNAVYEEAYLLSNKKILERKLM